MNLATIKQKLADLKPELYTRWGVAEIGVFGSFVRGEEKRRSDLDILVDFDREIDLFDFMELEEFLSIKLRRKVDLAPRRNLRKYIGRYILAEVQYV